MTSQVGARFFKYEKNYFSGESVEHLQVLKRAYSSILKGSYTQNTSIKHKPNIQNKYVRQNKASNVQSVSASASLFTPMFHLLF